MKKLLFIITFIIIFIGYFCDLNTQIFLTALGLVFLIIGIMYVFIDKIDNLKKTK